MAYPLPLDASISKGRFSFAPPSTVKVVGSWLLQTHFRKQFSVDLAIEIPQVCVCGGGEWCVGVWVVGWICDSVCACLVGVGVSGVGVRNTNRLCTVSVSTS